jgi:adenylate kinase
VGKGTYSSILSKELRIPHLSTGELLRREISMKTELGREVESYVSRGLLVPDKIVNDIVAKRLCASDCANGFILDGYPRTLPQAVFLEEYFPLDKVVLLQASLETIIERICGRLYCPNCGETYHVSWKPPKRDNICDKCGVKLTRRTDDSPEVVKRRYEEYLATVSPVVDFYKKLGKLVPFRAEGDSQILAYSLLRELSSSRTEILVEK